MPEDPEILWAVFQAALNAALPGGKFDIQPPQRRKGRTFVLGARQGIRQNDRSVRTGVAARNRYGHAFPTRSIASSG